MSKKYKLIFEDKNDVRHDFCEFEAKDDQEAMQTATRLIYKDREKIGYKVYYIRSWLHETETVFDFGSHYEFYYMKEIDQ